MILAGRVPHVLREGLARHAAVGEEGRRDQDEEILWPASENSDVNVRDHTAYAEL